MNGIFSVAQLNRFVSELIVSNPQLSSVQVRGEISGYKKYPSGHSYFQLKDKDSQVSCVMFRGNSGNLSFIPEDGMKVIVTAKASLYEQEGRFQLVVFSMEQDGIGDLFRQFELLKFKLRDQGLFDQDHKKAIPYIPGRIGVISSPQGAVIRDIINVLSRRFPGFDLLLFPSAVQGSSAATEIITGIKWFNENRSVDVIIIARGGGSIEDLWCFNDELLARAIYSSEIPVISAIGHETDYTISDFVADLRAPTPSAAAELVLPNKAELIRKSIENKSALLASAKHFIDLHKGELKAFSVQRAVLVPKRRVESEYQKIDIYSKRLSHAFQAKMISATGMCTIIREKLSVLNPLNVLSRGYAIVSNEFSENIYSVHQIKSNQIVSVRLSDGSFSAITTKTEPGG